MKPSEVLRAARKLIERPECWCRGDYALDATGLPCGSTEPRAVRFCSVGAYVRAKLDAGACEILGMAEFKRLLGVEGRVQRWNDDADHPEVLAAFDRAIALAEAEESPAPELERGRE